MAQRNTFRDDEDLEEKINMRDLARVGVYLKPYMARVVWILIVVAAMGCINVVEPYLTKIMIDSVIPAKNLALLGELVALLAVLIVIYEFGLRYRTVEITRVGQLMLKDMRRDLFTHIQTLPFSYFDSRPHGKILIRVVNYVNTLSDTLSSGLVNVISDVFTFFINASGSCSSWIGVSRCTVSRCSRLLIGVGCLGFTAFPASRVPGAIQ